jgi:hypothetical protein
MMINEEVKLAKLIDKLTKLTISHQLTWQIDNAPHALTGGTNDMIPFFYTTEYKNQKVGIAEIRYQRYDGEYERFYWANRLSLVFLTLADHLTWHSEEPLRGLESLFSVARNSASNVENIVNDLLSDNDEEDN